MSETNGLGIAGFTLGVISVIACWVPFLPIPVVVTGIVMSRIGIRQGKAGAPYIGLSIAGLVLGIVGAVAVLVATGYWVGIAIGQI